MRKGEGTALVLIPVVKVTDLTESFGLVGSRLGSHPCKPEYDTRAPGVTPLPRSDFILLSFVFMNCMNSRRNNEI